MFILFTTVLADFDADLLKLSGEFDSPGNVFQPVFIVNIVNIYFRYTVQLLFLCHYVSDIFQMDTLYICLSCLVIFLLVLSIKVLRIFLSLSSSSGHSNVMIGRGL